jgi:hypothetical protein
VGPLFQVVLHQQVLGQWQQQALAGGAQAGLELGIEPVKTWEGEPKHTQHDSPAAVLITATTRVAGSLSGAAHKSI